MTDEATISNITATDYDTIDLYAIWRKEIRLTFNLNGGYYKGVGDDIVLEGTVYNNETQYVFSLNDTTTPNGISHDEQVNTIDAYGSVGHENGLGWTEGGVNYKYTKVSSNGVQYRLLGWSLDRNAKVPGMNLSILNKPLKVTYTVSDNTTLYAVWEPVLSVNIILDRSLGTLSSDSSVTRITNITAQSKNPTLKTIIQPGEQG